MEIILLQLSDRPTVKKKNKQNQTNKRKTQPKLKGKGQRAWNQKNFQYYYFHLVEQLRYQIPLMMEHCILHHYKSQGSEMPDPLTVFMGCFKEALLILKRLVFSCNAELFKEIKRLTSSKTNPYSTKIPYLLTAIHLNDKLAVHLSITVVIFTGIIMSMLFSANAKSSYQLW